MRHYVGVNASHPSPAGFPCLNQVDLFRDLTPEEMMEFAAIAPRREFARGELLFNQSDPVESLFILSSGRVRVFRVSEDGKALTISILQPGAVFGEMALVGQRMYGNHAEALEHSEVCTLSSADVERFLLSDPRIAVRISHLLGERVADLETRLADVALRSLPARVATLLARMADPSAKTTLGGDYIIRLTHEQLAGLVGVTRESVSKVVAELAGQGVIRQRRGSIVITDLERLRAYANG
ncbi:Crp/Fnr family transcriptional regulator [Dermabacteraceae bacterium TAE3-ERU27]|nr:Crp/Fnr family transcriptional regulator [Dermabacteraceae bacterium TAE3-ERU27]